MPPTINSLFTGLHVRRSRVNCEEDRGENPAKSVEFFSTIRNKSVNALKIEDRINNGKNAFVRVATFR